MSYAPDLLSVMSQELLDVAHSFLATGVDREFVSQAAPTAPVGDCSQLTVHIIALDTVPIGQQKGVPDPRPMRGAVEPIVRFGVTLYRCASSLTEQGNEPAAATLDAEGKAMMDEAFGLFLGLMQTCINQQIWTDAKTVNVVTDSSVTWQSAPSLQPQGGMAGWFIQTEVKLA